MTAPTPAPTAVARGNEGLHMRRGHALRRVRVVSVLQRGALLEVEPVGGPLRSRKRYELAADAFTPTVTSQPVTS